MGIIYYLTLEYSGKTASPSSPSSSSMESGFATEFPGDDWNDDSSEDFEVERHRESLKNII
jgi:hypothetical protein